MGGTGEDVEGSPGFAELYAQKEAELKTLQEQAKLVSLLVSSSTGTSGQSKKAGGKSVKGRKKNTMKGTRFILKYS